MSQNATLNRTEILALFRVGESDRQALRNLKPWFDANMTRIVDAFYNHVESIPEAMDVIRRSGASIKGLKERMPAYFDHLFVAEFEGEYFRSRMLVGQIHAKIGLEPKWFFGAMTAYIDEIFPSLLSDPALTKEFAIMAACALQKVLALDKALIVDFGYVASNKLRIDDRLHRML